MPIGKMEKAVFNDEVKELKVKADEMLKMIVAITTKKKKFPAISAYYDVEAVTYVLNFIQLNLKMSDLSVEILGIKNELNLTIARKEYYKAIGYFENLVGSEVERSLRENDEYLKKIEKLNPKQILNLVNKMHDILNDLRNKIGENSKWKWSFVEMQARVAVITKNITNFSDIAKFRDPRSDYYEERLELMSLCKQSLEEAAKQYRTKYELSGKSREDLKKCIDLLSSLRKIYVLFDETDEAEKLRNTIDASRLVLESSDKNKKKVKK
jgi:hypothetical protein